MEVDTMTGPPTAEVKAEEGSQKGEKATYKSFKYVLTVQIGSSMLLILGLRMFVESPYYSF
jgi:hypothetical protein